MNKMAIGKWKWKCPYKGCLGGGVKPLGFGIASRHGRQHLRKVHNNYKTEPILICLDDKMEELSYEAFKQACLEIAKRVERRKFSSVFGVPRGGLIVAVHVSHLLDIPLVSVPRKGTLVVDDIVDSGKTIKKYRDRTIASIYYHRHSIVEPDIWIYEKTDAFIKFHWETDETAKIDYENKKNNILGKGFGNMNKESCSRFLNCKNKDKCIDCIGYKYYEPINKNLFEGGK